MSRATILAAIAAAILAAVWVALAWAGDVRERVMV